MVEKRFTSVSEGQVAEQSFDGSFDGKDVQLRNLILTLPGESPRSVVVLASRDSASGPGAASSAAATATLLELVDKLRTARHTKTLVFVSTDGGSAGAAGAREFAEHFAQRDLIDGAVVLWQPGSATPRQPSLLDASDGSQSPSAQLVRTAEQALSEQTGRRPQLEGLFGELARLALPSGLGEQAVLIANGIDAVGLSSAGERPLPVADDQPDDLSAATLGDLGRAALLLVASLDAHGRAPGARSRRLPEPGGKPRSGLGARPAGADAAASGGARVAGLPAAGVPEPGESGLGAGLVGVPGAAAPRRRAAPLPAGGDRDRRQAALPLRSQPLSGRSRTDRGDGLPGDRDRWPATTRSGVGASPRGCPPRWPLPALGLVSALAVLVAWLANPYLALLLVPVAHVWLLDARRGGAFPWPLALGAIAALARFRSPPPSSTSPGGWTWGRRALAAPPDGGGRPDRVRLDARPLPPRGYPGGTRGARPAADCRPTRRRDSRPEAGPPRPPRRSRAQHLAPRRTIWTHLRSRHAASDDDLADEA